MDEWVVDSGWMMAERWIDGWMDEWWMDGWAEVKPGAGYYVVRAWSPGGGEGGGTCRESCLAWLHHH